MKFSTVKVGEQWAVSLRQGGAKKYISSTLTDSELDAKQQACIRNIQHHNDLMNVAWQKLYDISETNTDGVFILSYDNVCTLDDLMY